ncbi:MAG: ABC-F family ATP-binding cassette domain-containing protein [Flavobacteriales bacterium]|nr:ABC-F family ATP-binding cassette domain-containing protein [Flavobacteriales bacterium]
MNYLSVERVGKRFGPRQLFEDISFGLERGQKMGLLARNGAGKSTLLKCIAGLDKPDTGIITFRKDIRVAYLQQDVHLSSASSLVDEVLDNNDPVSVAIRAYEHALAKHSDDLQQAIDRMEEVHAWDHEARIKGILHLFGLEDLEQPVNTLSGGQQKRLALAKTLVTKPDLVILDEPTNHLDMDMIEMLEDELSAPGMTLLLVTHDRYFLDRVCDEIVELESGELHRFKGNYSYYVEKRAALDEVRDATQDKLRSLVRHELEWIRKMPRARGTKSKSRVDAFYDMKEEASKKFDKEDVSLEIIGNRLGGKVIEARNLTKSYGEKKIVSKFNYSFKAGDRFGIVGSNGIGKSTFVDLLIGRVQPDAGTTSMGDTVVLGYFDQKGLQLKEDRRVLDVVRDIAEIIPMSKGRKITASQLLERFLFSKEQQQHWASTLSGGERRRLHLCTVLMKNPNVLILDEPTNDLDIPTLNALEDFLAELNVCLLVISHDRFFMDKICGRLLVFEGDGHIKEFVGNYTELRERKRVEKLRLSQANAQARNAAVEAAQQEKVEKPRTKKLTYAERLELEKLNTDVPELEERKEKLTASFAEAGIGHEELLKRGAELEALIKELESKSERWLALTEKAEGE